MSHLIKICAVCKFSCFRHWNLKSYSNSMPNMKTAEFANSVNPDVASGSTLFALWSLNSQYDIPYKF